MKKQIENIEDLKLLVDSFYAKVIKDETLGYIFTNVAKVNWEEHLPRMYSFWETILFGRISFKGNPVIKHTSLNEQHPLTEEHFTRWIYLWHETVDELFTGTLAENAKTKAVMMKTIMLSKIQQNLSPTFVV